MSRRARICCAPPGPVQSPGSTIRSSTRTPSEVVVPTCRPARSRMWVISRVTVLLPFVPEIETTGIRRSASRIQVGGVVRASAIRSVQRASEPLLARRSAGRSATATRRARPGRGRPRSSVRARSAPAHGKVTIQWPGIGRAMDGAGRRGPRRARAAAAGPRRRARRRRPASRARGTARAEVDERVAARVALAVPGPAPADGDLELDHRLEPVDVGAFEQADLDQAHGPGRIASARRG